MPFEGHVDFYGSHAGAAGWFFSGWSIAWRGKRSPARVTARFQFRDLGGDGNHLATFFEREDLGNSGIGFVLLIPDTTKIIGQFIGLSIRSGGTTIEIAPTPSPPRLVEAELTSKLLSLLKDSKIDAIGEILCDILTGPVAPASAPDGRIKNAQRLDRNEQLACIRQSGLFDPNYYSLTYEDARNSSDLVEHFYDSCLKGSRNPNLYFDTAWYLQNNPDGRARG
jgi:hypothetical protein